MSIHPSRLNPWNALFWGVTLASMSAFAYTAYWGMFSSFAHYDDEGFCLLTIHLFHAGHPLYDTVYSVYQPFYFIFFRGISLFTGGHITHDTGRLVTLALLLASSTVSGLLVCRIHRGGIPFLLGFTVSSILLYGLAWEPTHPQALCLFLAILLAYACTIHAKGGRDIHLVCTGILLGLLLMTKLNIGVLYSAAVFSVLLCRSRHPSARKVGTACALTLPVFAPLLMRTFLSGSMSFLVLGGAVAVCAGAFPMLNMRSTRSFSLSLAALAFLVVAIHMTARHGAGDAPLPGMELYGMILALFLPFVVLWGLDKEQRTCSLRSTGLALVSFGVAAALCVAYIMGRGTSLGGVVDGMIWLPFSQSESFSIAWKNTAFLFLVSGAGLLLFLVVHRLRNGDGNRAVHAILPFVYTGFSGVAVLFALRSHSLLRSVDALHGLPSYWMAPFSWMLLYPCGSKGAYRSERLPLFVFSVVSPLISFPVYGGQRMNGYMFLLLSFLVVFMESFDSLAGNAMAAAKWEGGLRRLVRFRFLLPLLILAVFAQSGVKARSRYLSYAPLALPGSGRIRLEGDQSHFLRGVVEHVRGGAMLLTVPGMYSFHLWAGCDELKRYTMTNWHVVLSDEEQREIVSQIMKSDGKVHCITIVPLDQMWGWCRVRNDGPLIRFLFGHFTLEGSYGLYEVLGFTPSDAR